MRVVKMYSNGLVHVKEIEFKEGEAKYRAFAEEIGCDYIEFVNPLPEFIEGPYAMICDEEFLLKDKAVFNLIASVLYGIQKHGQPLFGDVLFVKEENTEDGIETVSIEPEDVKVILEAINKALELS